MSRKADHTRLQLKARWVDYQIDQGWHRRIRNILTKRGIDTADLPTDTRELALHVGVPVDRVAAGVITHNEVEWYAKAWAMKQPRSSSTVTHSIGALTETLGCSSGTINKYARLAGVEPPGRGKRNHRFSAIERAKILRAVMNGGDQKRREKAAAALRNRPENQK